MITGAQGQAISQALTNPGAALAAAGAAGGTQYLEALNQQNQMGAMFGLGQGNPLVAAAYGQEAPAIAQYGQQYGVAEAGLASLGQSQARQDALLQQETGLSGQQLQNQLAGNTLQQQNIAQQLGITGQQYQLSQQNIEQQLGIAGGQYGLQQQLGAIQAGQLAYNYPIAVSQAQGQEAISGTQNTVGGRRQIGQLGEQYEVSQAELANQMASQGLTYQGEQLAAQNQLAQGAVGYRGQQLSSANQMAQLQNTAASLGISQEQLQNQLASGMAQIGLQTGQTGDQLLGQAATARAGQAQGYGAILSNIGAITGLGPAAFQPTLPNLYGGL